MSTCHRHFIYNSLASSQHSLVVFPWLFHALSPAAPVYSTPGGVEDNESLFMFILHVHLPPSVHVSGTAAAVSAIPPASYLLHSASCYLHPASCLLPAAFCQLPPASCFLPPASCLLPGFQRCSTLSRSMLGGPPVEQSYPS